MSDIGAANTASDVRDEVDGWLRHLGRRGRTVDVDGARPIFAEEAVGFGASGAMLDGLDAPVAGQWQNIWLAELTTQGVHRVEARRAPML